ncbi:MAG: peptidoglycan DD-metalloendopeptidase family protein [Proteobacteria bacterium]|nr:peptidoglycan DD-metalloendopeptidase family protein [Pseudomonadota bacterium]MDA1063353.1 peptidoglycan DD-metalloendopeptidase family protein [Pseudomonadota bacterium]
MRRSLLLLMLVCGTAGAESVSWPGGVATLDLGSSGDATPVVEYQGQRVLVSNNAGRWQAVVGIPLDAAPGVASITLADGTERSFSIAPHAYREQHLTVAPGFVALSEENLARVGREREIIDAALNNWRDASLDGVNLRMPVDGPRDSSFGSRRFFNKEPRSPHSGMDIAAKSGTPVMTPRAGIVTTVGDFYFNGNTVIVDHGQGFITMYCHLSEISVAEDQPLALGEQLGAVGATGRVTGAHLHFGTYLNGNAVDPALLLDAASN